MNRRFLHAAMLLLAAGCASAANEPATSADPGARGTVVPQTSSTTVWQLSPFALLVDGGFRGVVTAREVAQHGDMGVGAADRLDGEIAVVNGRFYQFLAGGLAVAPDPTLTLPFAIMTKWNGGPSLTLDVGQQYTAPLLPAVDAHLPTTDAFYALVITGTFSVVQARTFKCQNPPYTRITSAMEDRFTVTNVQGTMVGFREPRYVDSLSVPNYHLHFITTNRTPQLGGHVLGFTAGPGVTLQYSLRPYFTVYMPPNPSFTPAPPCPPRTADGA
jgi:acetolactate decarboxylase